MNMAQGEYKIVLGESFKNEKNTILLGITLIFIYLEDLKTLSLYDSKTNEHSDFNNINIHLDNINKQIKVNNNVFLKNVYNIGNCM